MIKTILVPVDGSQDSFAALKEAEVLAETLESKLIVLTVLTDSKVIEHYPGDFLTTDFRKAQALRGEQILERAMEAVDIKGEVETVVRTG